MTSLVASNADLAIEAARGIRRPLATDRYLSVSSWSGGGSAASRSDHQPEASPSSAATSTAATRRDHSVGTGLVSVIPTLLNQSQFPRLEKISERHHNG